MTRRPLAWFVLIAGVCGPWLGAAGGAGMEPLRTPLPRPAFVGTPTMVVSAHLERPTGKLRDPFMVPQGTVNLARGKRVTSSAMAPVLGSLERVVDGGKEADGRSFVELPPGCQWVQIDLGARHVLRAVVVWHYHAEARVYRDVVIRVGDDPDFTDAARTLFHNDHDNSSGLGVGMDLEYIETFEGRLIDAAGAAARYVRLYSNGNTTDDMNHYVEVEVFGDPEPAP